MSENTNIVITSEDVVKAVKNMENKAKEASLGKKKWYDKVGAIAEAIVPEIEEIGTKAQTFQRLTGPQKKDLALNLVEMLYFKLFNSKYFPDSIERFMVRLLASFAIDSAVALANRTGLFKHYSTV